MNPHVVRRQSKRFQKLKNVDPKVPNQAKVERDVVINPQNYNSIIFTRKMLMLSKRYESTDSTVELGCMCPR